MESPFAFQPGKPVVTIGHVFGTPLAVQGWIGLPLNQVIFWALFSWLSIKKHGSWPAWQHLLSGGLQMAVVLGSEWCHNLAHVAAARAVGKPVDTVRILAGMPVLIYNEPEHPSVTPRQHVIRSAAGPVCNALLLVLSKGFQQVTPPDSALREVADAAAAMNTFISFGSLTPIPAFDGGPIFKWSLIARGHSPASTAAILSRASRFAGAGLVAASAAAVYKRNWLLAVMLALLGVLSSITGFGKSRH
jgi:Zn-dependent protease